MTALWSRGPLAGWLTAAVLLPFSVRPDVPHPGDSIRASANLQVQPARWLALRLGVNGRADTAAAFREELVPSSGGAQVHVAHEVVLSPVSDLVLTFGLAVPVVQEMRAYRVTSPVALASLGFDL